MTFLKRKRFLIVSGVILLTTGLLCVSTLSLLNTIRPQGIIVHHTAIPPRPDGRSVDAALIDAIHRSRGFSIFYWGSTYHIGYHYLILADGTIQLGRPDHCRGAHAQGFNSYLGIALTGNFSTNGNPDGTRGLAAPTEAQLQSLRKLCEDLNKRYDIPPEKILRHSDVNPGTDCPGDRLPFELLLESLKDGPPSAGLNSN